jgi:xanthine/uracil permease
MQWDLGVQGLALLGAMSLGFGVLSGAIVGRSWGTRLLTAVITTSSCFVIGLFTSEVMFGWATEEELQPNIDGLSRDEVLLSGVLTTAAVVLLGRYLARRQEDRRGASHRRMIGRHAGHS